MNYRIFSSSDNLLDGLEEAIDRALAGTLRPHVGMIGPDPFSARAEKGSERFDAFLELARRISQRDVSLVGSPRFVHEVIVSLAPSLVASPEDLGEPLDLVLGVGSAPAALPGWFPEGRTILIAALDRSEAESWVMTGSDRTERSWFFLLEEDVAISSAD